MDIFYNEFRPNRPRIWKFWYNSLIRLNEVWLSLSWSSRNPGFLGTFCKELLYPISWKSSKRFSRDAISQKEWWIGVVCTQDTLIYFVKRSNNSAKNMFRNVTYWIAEHIILTEGHARTSAIHDVRNVTLTRHRSAWLKLFTFAIDQQHIINVDICKAMKETINCSLQSIAHSAENTRMWHVKCPR